MKLKFNEKKHEYTYNKEKFISVTELISKYFDEFNPKEVARKLSKIPKNKQEKKGVRYFLKLWKSQQEEGTLVHKELELISQLDMGQTYSWSHLKTLQGAKALQAIHEEYPDRYKLLSEYRICSPEFKVAGTIDLLQLFSDGTGIIYDYKTNQKLNKDSYKGKMGKGFCKDIPDSNYWHYVLQLNIYKYILEYNYDIKIRKIYIIHLMDNNYEFIELPNLQQYALAILERNKITE